jgi:shikimate kinase
MAPPPAERVVLLGFMASGKTTVGRLLAARLGWRHVDLDEEIEREEGRSVAEIFREEGEAYFRRREAEATGRLVEPPGTVLTPGGGWVTDPSLLDLLPAGTLTVWLHVSPEEVLRRVGAGAEALRRPLLAGPDPEGTVRRLLRERDALYRRAAHLVRTDGRDPERIARDIESILRGRSDAPPPSS